MTRICVARGWVRALVVAGVAGVVGLGGAVATAAPASEWSIAPSPDAHPTYNWLMAVSARSTTRAWAVGVSGTKQDGARRTLVERWNGSAWSLVPDPLLQGGLWAVAQDASGGVWVGGQSGGSDGCCEQDAAGRAVVQRWSGGVWTTWQLPHPVWMVHSAVRGVLAVSPTSVWVVGVGYDAGLAEHPLIEHWDGVSWRVAYSPADVNGGLHAITRVPGTAQIWAVGNTDDFVAHAERTLVMRWDGGGWSVTAGSNSVGTLEAITGVPGTQQLIAAGASDGFPPEAGGYTDGQLIVALPSGAATLVSAPVSHYCNGVCAFTGIAATSATSAWAVAGRADGFGSAYANIDHWNGTTWNPVVVPDPPFPIPYGNCAALEAIARVPDTTQLWAVGVVGDYGACGDNGGSDSSSPDRTLIMQRNVG